MVPAIRDTVYIPLVKEYREEKGILSQVDFDRVGWYDTRQAMDMSLDMYQMWHENQVTSL